jgi:hypothetical protein
MQRTLEAVTRYSSAHFVKIHIHETRNARLARRLDRRDYKCQLDNPEPERSILCEGVVGVVGVLMVLGRL